MLVGCLTDLGYWACKDQGANSLARPGRIVVCRYCSPNPMRVDVFVVVDRKLQPLGCNISLQNPGAGVVILSAGRDFNRAQKVLTCMNIAGQ